MKVNGSIFIEGCLKGELTQSGKIFYFVPLDEKFILACFIVNISSSVWSKIHGERSN